MQHMETRQVQMRRVATLRKPREAQGRADVSDTGTPDDDGLNAFRGVLCGALLGALLGALMWIGLIALCRLLL